MSQLESTIVECGDPKDSCGETNSSYPSFGARGARAWCR